MPHAPGLGPVLPGVDATEDVTGQLKIGIRTTDEGIISVSHWGLPRWLSGKEFACQCRRHRRLGFDTWVGEIPLRRTQQPPPVPGKSHRHWSLVGYSLRGYRVRHDLATEHTHVHQHYIY